MSNTFEEKLNEDIRGAFRKLGSALIAKGKRAGEDASMKFWARLGDAKAEGQLDFNYMMDDLQDHYEYFCGTLRYEQTARSFIDFVGVLSQKPEFDTKTLMAMMGGRTDPMKMRSPNEGVIDEIFEKIGKNEIQGQDIPEAVEQIERLSANRQDKALIFEYMRLVVQNNPQMLERAEWSRLLPFVDRYLSDQELNAAFTTVAKNMLRSRAVQDYAPEQEGAKSQDPQDAAEKGAPDNTSKRAIDGTSFSTPLKEPTEAGPFPRQNIIREEMRKLGWSFEMQRVANEGEYKPSVLGGMLKPERINLVAALYIGLLAARTANIGNKVGDDLNEMAQEVGASQFTPAIAKACYFYLRAGGDANVVGADLEHFMDNKNKSTEFLSRLMKYVSEEYNGQEEEQEQK